MRCRVRPAHNFERATDRWPDRYLSLLERKTGQVASGFLWLAPTQSTAVAILQDQYDRAIPYQDLVECTRNVRWHANRDQDQASRCGYWECAQRSSDDRRKVLT